MSSTIRKAVSLLFWSHQWIFLALAGWVRASSLPRLNPVDEFDGTKVQQSSGYVTKNVLRRASWVTDSYTPDVNSVSTTSSNRRHPIDQLTKEFFRPSTSTEDQPSLPTFPRSTKLPSEGDIPPYMMDVLNQFSLLNGKRPKANIVRSFLDQGKQCQFDEDQMFKGSTDRVIDKSLPFERALLFNVTIPNYETLYTAELRLFMVVISSSTNKRGAIAKVSVFHDNGASLKQVIVRTMYRLESGWESFLLTDFVRNRMHLPRPFKRKTSRTSGSYTLRFRVRIESAYFPYLDNMSSQINIGCFDRIEYKTLLAIYSDDAQSPGRIVETEKEKMALLQNDEIANVVNSRILEDYLPGKPLSSNEEAVSYQLGINSKINHESMAVLPVSPNKDEIVDTYEDSFKDDTRDSATKNGDEPLSKFVSSNDESRSHSYRAKRAARNYCRRIPMEVDFRKIGWDTWVKFPAKYQAYKCVGKCFYPITPNWSPSNHAIVQSLMHMYDRSVNRPCCVPVEFGSISMMYLNENNVLTFKYDYREMIVRACGCQ